MPRIRRGSDPRITAQGDRIAVAWTTHVEGAPHGAGPMATAFSNDGGKTWHQGQSAADWPRGPHGFFAMASDDKAMHMVWLDSRGGKGQQGLRHAHSLDGGAVWSKNTTLDDKTCACCWNTVSLDGQGQLYTLYRDKDPSDIALGRLVGLDGPWERTGAVGAFDWDFHGCPHIGGDLELQAKPEGLHIHAVVGTGHPQHLGVHYLLSRDGGQTWGEPSRLGDETALHANLAAHPDGRLVSVWDMMDVEGLAIYMAESTDGGDTWSQPTMLSKPGIRATHPLAVATKDGFLVLWTEMGDKNVLDLATHRI